MGTGTRVSAVAFPPLALVGLLDHGVCGAGAASPSPRLLWSPARDAGADAARVGVEGPLTASGFALTPLQIVQGFSTHPF